MFVTFRYESLLLTVSYGSRPMSPLEVLHVRSVRLLVPVESTLGFQTNPPLLTAAIVLPSPIPGVAPSCGNTTTRSTHPGLGLAGSGGLCSSEALSSFLATFTFTFNETPPYCIETLSV
ncbi:Protein kinase domain-containing protein [Raphanus sativus]|nr:Protein kinase domain-containing protein [Raphanus sativus]